LILVLSIFNIAFWLYILSSGKKKEAHKQQQQEGGRRTRS
jgi:cbb3-type cytochrome oxidase subunit 3